MTTQTNKDLDINNISEISSVRKYRYILYRENYYDSLNKEYKYIITINKVPEGILKNNIKKITIEEVGKKMFIEKSCKLVICNNIYGNNDLSILDYEKLPDLINYLLENNYILDNDLLNTIINKDTININNKKIILFFKYIC